MIEIQELLQKAPADIELIRAWMKKQVEGMPHQSAAGRFDCSAMTVRNLRDETDIKLGTLTDMAEFYLAHFEEKS